MVDFNDTMTDNYSTADYKHSTADCNKYDSLQDNNYSTSDYNYSMAE